MVCIELHGYGQDYLTSSLCQVNVHKWNWRIGDYGENTGGAQFTVPKTMIFMEMWFLLCLNEELIRQDAHPQHSFYKTSLKTKNMQS